jgi:DNA-binding MarR family transcriptional regulator
MEVLAMIQNLNEREIKPDLKILSKRVKVTMGHLEMIISNLFKMDLVDSESAVRDFVITTKGRRTIDGYRNQASDFAALVLRDYQTADKNGLYTYITNNKDLLRFAYHQRFLTKDDIKKVARKLDASVARLWWDKSLQGWGSRYQTSWDYG